MVYCTLDCALMCAKYGCMKVFTTSVSSGNIVFDSNSVAKDAYETYGIRGIPFDPEVAAKLTEEERRYLQWRECGRFHLKAFTGLFVRYAVEGDRKERRAAEKSQYYKKHGRVVEDNKEDTVVDLRCVCVCVCVCLCVLCNYISM